MGVIYRVPVQDRGRGVDGGWPDDDGVRGQEAMMEIGAGKRHVRRTEPGDMGPNERAAQAKGIGAYLSGYLDDTFARFREDVFDAEAALGKDSARERGRLENLAANAKQDRARREQDRLDAKARHRAKYEWLLTGAEPPKEVTP